MRQDNIIQKKSFALAVRITNLYTYKEAKETVDKLKLLLVTDYLNQEHADSLLKDTEDICKILGNPQITIRNHNFPPSKLINFNS